MLLPKDPNDEKNAFIEIRAGTGGDEADYLLVICLGCFQAIRKT